MSLTVAQLAYLRSEIGTTEPPDDGELEVAYARLGTVEAVAAEVIRGRLADLLAEPASFTVEGYSENNAANIAALTKQSQRLDAAVSLAAGGSFSRSTLTRVGWAR